MKTLKLTCCDPFFLNLIRLLFFPLFPRIFHPPSVLVSCFSLRILGTSRGLFFSLSFSHLTILHLLLSRFFSLGIYFFSLFHISFRPLKPASRKSVFRVPKGGIAGDETWLITPPGSTRGCDMAYNAIRIHPRMGHG